MRMCTCADMRVDMPGRCLAQPELYRGHNYVGHNYVSAAGTWLSHSSSSRQRLIARLYCSICCTEHSNQAPARIFRAAARADLHVAVGRTNFELRAKRPRAVVLGLAFLKNEMERPTVCRVPVDLLGVHERLLSSVGQISVCLSSVGVAADLLDVHQRLLSSVGQSSVGLSGAGVLVDLLDVAPSFVHWKQLLEHRAPRVRTQLARVELDLHE